MINESRWSAPFHGIRGDMTLQQAADMALAYLNTDKDRDQKISMSPVGGAER